MKIKALPFDMTVCKLRDTEDIDLEKELFFVGRTEQEISLVCRMEDVPACTAGREDGWRGFFIQEKLDFSLIGIIAEISRLLAENRIGIFVVSTFNTDYVFVKKENFRKALRVLAENGYEVSDSKEEGS